MTRMTLLFVACLMALCPAAVRAADFRGIGFLPGNEQYSDAHAVSADGRVVVGEARPGHHPEDAVLWTRGGGLEYLGDLSGGDTRSLATDVSGNGLVVVGRGFSQGATEAFRWTQSDGMKGIGFLNSDTRSSSASGVSADGSVVVGSSSNADLEQNLFWGEAYRWTESGGMVGLGDLSGGPISSSASDISADGSIIVGWSNSELGSESFRWTETGGMTRVGDLPGGIYESFASAISASGAFIVGSSFSDLGQEAYRWNDVHGMQPLGFLPGLGDFSSGNAVSDAGVVVGYSGRGTELAFIWSEHDGMRNLRDVLANDYGLVDQLSGWTLTLAADITPDGRTIVGYGINPDGNQEGWVFSVPEPSSQALAAILAIGFGATAARNLSINRLKERASPLSDIMLPDYPPSHNRRTASRTARSTSSRRKPRRNCSASRLSSRRDSGDRRQRSMIASRKSRRLQ